MHRRVIALIIMFTLSSLSVAVTSSRAQAQGSSITSQNAQIEGGVVHYLKAGSGPAVLLLHGYTQTSHMWRHLIPQLASRFTVIAPDLPGIGDSGSLEGDNDMSRAAQRIHALVRSLGIEKASVVGHDIGLMVAYAYAAQYGSETTKLAVLDAFLPGVVSWRDAYDSSDYWHFRFHGSTPEALVKGRERIYYDYYWNEFAADKSHSIPDADRKVYAAAYARPGHMKSGWSYFASFPGTAKDFEVFAKKKLTMPVLSIGGQQAFGDFLGKQMKAVAENVTVVVIEKSGHWLMEEQTKPTTEALLRFLNTPQS